MGDTKWKKGQSGNPGGRPKVLAEVTELARKAVPGSLKTLIAIRDDPEQPAPARVAAANAIWDRAYGKPVQTTINYNETLDGFTDDEISRFLAAIRAELGAEAGNAGGVGARASKARKQKEAGPEKRLN
jgi:hypothetical protein